MIAPARLISSIADDERLTPVAAAIDYLVDSAEAPPDLNGLADIVGLSPTYFQKLFKEGAGVSPKRFLQCLSAERARVALHDGASVLDAALAAGLSGPSRMHDLFLHAEAMTPGAYRRRGAGETIRYGEARGPFGATLIGATEKGICWLSFAEARDFGRSVVEMKKDWPAADFIEDAAAVAPLAAAAFAHALGTPNGPVALHVAGTNFQIKVWEALLRIPSGATASYGAIADIVCSRRASRAVGAAVGANPVSLLIPCHRVIKASGAVHNYRWGAARKKALLALEEARVSH
ncbi:MAG: methylated-DNA--[protein]-cysteine S-methyltransferase [Pseudomonadota bacterium]